MRGTRSSTGRDLESLYHRLCRWSPNLTVAHQGQDRESTYFRGSPWADRRASDSLQARGHRLAPLAALGRRSGDPGRFQSPALVRRGVSGYETSPYRVEWMRFEAESPLPELIRTVPHVAFVVDDLRRGRSRFLRGRQLVAQGGEYGFPRKGFSRQALFRRGS